MKKQGRALRHKRTRKKVSGTTTHPRVCVFRSKKHIYAQIINDQDSKTILAFSTRDKEFLKTGLKTTNQKAAQMLGETLAKKAIEKGIQQVCFDKAGYLFHGRVKALAEGLRKGGLKL